MTPIILSICVALATAGYVYTHKLKGLDEFGEGAWKGYSILIGIGAGTVCYGLLWLLGAIL